MKVTVIPTDNAVYVDGVSFLDLDLSDCDVPKNIHALQWNDTYGEIEFVPELNNGVIEKQNNQLITELPEWVNNVLDLWHKTKFSIENQPLYVNTADDNSDKAKMLLSATDWVMTIGIDDPLISNPYLLNRNDFIEYRNLLRNIAINPQEGNIDFPIKPDSMWSNT